MTLSNDANAKRKIIMDHYLHPRHFGKIAHIDPQKSPGIACDDQLTLYLKIADQKIVNLKFEGTGCAIFIASTDLMISRVLKQTIEDVKKILKHYQNMIEQNDDYDEKLLGDLVVFNHVKAQLNRLDCAKMIANALQKQIDNFENVK